MMLILNSDDDDCHLLSGLASHVAHTPLPLLHHHYYKQANYTCWHINYLLIGK